MRAYEEKGGPSPLTGKTNKVFEDPSCTPGTLTVKVHPWNLQRSREFFALLKTQPVVIVPSPLIPKKAIHIHCHPDDYAEVVRLFEDPSV